MWSCMKAVSERWEYFRKVLFPLSNKHLVFFLFLFCWRQIFHGIKVQSGMPPALELLSRVPTRGSPRLLSQVACLVLLWQHLGAHIGQDVRRLRGSQCIHFTPLTQAVGYYWFTNDCSKYTCSCSRCTSPSVHQYNRPFFDWLLLCVVQVAWRTRNQTDSSCSSTWC